MSCFLPSKMPFFLQSLPLFTVYCFSLMFLQVHVPVPSTLSRRICCGLIWHFIYFFLTGLFYLELVILLLNFSNHFTFFELFFVWKNDFIFGYDWKNTPWLFGGLRKESKNANKFSTPLTHVTHYHYNLNWNLFMAIL